MMISTKTAGACNDLSVAGQTAQQRAEESCIHLMLRISLIREQSAQMDAFLLYVFLMKLSGILSLGFSLSVDMGQDNSRKEMVKNKGRGRKSDVRLATIPVHHQYRQI